MRTHRTVVVIANRMQDALGIAGASWAGGLLTFWAWWRSGVVIVALLLLLILAWYRAKQRGIYYVREVLLIAEKVLDERKAEVR